MIEIETHGTSNTYKGLVGRRDLQAGSRPEADGRLEAVEAARADGRRGVTRPVQQMRRQLRRRRRRERVGRRQQALWWNSAFFPSCSRQQ